jgi:hypothetical protein
MPWLVGVTADATDLRWGLAVAALTPLLMYFAVFVSRFFFFSHAACHMPLVTCRLSHAACHMPLVTCRLSQAAVRAVFENAQTNKQHSGARN